MNVLDHMGLSFQVNRKLFGMLYLGEYPSTKMRTVEIYYLVVMSFKVVLWQFASLFLLGEFFQPDTEEYLLGLWPAKFYLLP
jgi:hypothetical protein